jgi:hypothetical protein
MEGSIPLGSLVQPPEPILLMRDESACDPSKKVSEGSFGLVGAGAGARKDDPIQAVYCRLRANSRQYIVQRGLMKNESNTKPVKCQGCSLGSSPTLVGVGKRGKWGFAAWSSHVSLFIPIIYAHNRSRPLPPLPPIILEEPSLPAVCSAGLLQ